MLDSIKLLNRLIYLGITISLLAINQSYAQSIPQQYTVLSLDFDNNQLIDRSDNKNVVIDHNTNFDQGINDFGLFLEGNGNFLEIEHSTSLKINQNVTSSLWYKHQNQTSNGYYSLIEQSANENGGHSRYGTWIYSKNRIQTCIEPDACPGGQGALCQRCVSTTKSLEEGEWYNIVSSYDGTTLKIFINGELSVQTKFSTSTGISVKPFPLTIGTDMYDSSPTYLKGTIDEVGLYNIALSDGQIEELYNKYKSTSLTNGDANRSITVFPNPTSNILYINNPTKIKSYTIYNQNGVPIKHEKDFQGGLIDIQFLPASKYYILLQDVYGVKSTKQFQVLN